MKVKVGKINESSSEPIYLLMVQSEPDVAELPFSDEDVDSMLLLRAADSNMSECMVFRILSVDRDGMVATGQALDHEFVIEMLMQDLSVAQQLTGVHLRALGTISEALGNPYKGDHSKTVLDLASLAADTIKGQATQASAPASTISTAD